MMSYRSLLVIPLMILLGCNSYSLDEPFQAENGLWGYKDAEGKIRIEPQFDRAYSFDRESIAIVLINGILKAINKRGGWESLTRYIRIEPAKAPHDVIRVRLNGKYGFVDQTGKEVVPIKYDGVSIFLNDEKAPGSVAKLNGKYGIIDKTGKEMVPIKYDKIDFFFTDAKIVRAKLNDKWGFIDQTGKVVIPFKYDEVKDDSQGPFSYEGQETIFLGFRSIFSPDAPLTNIAALTSDESWRGFSKRWPWGRGASEDAKVKLDGKWGLIDRTGNVVVPIKYDHLGSFKWGLIEVRLDGKDGYVDEYGNEYWDIKDPKFSSRNSIRESYPEYLED